MKFFTLMFFVSFYFYSYAETGTKPAISFLESSYQYALKETDRLKKEIILEGQKYTGYNACKVDELSLQLNYNEWFTKHYPEFQTLSSKIDDVVQDANFRIENIKNTVEFVNPVQNTITETVIQGDGRQITFIDIVKYLELFNGRLKECSPDAIASLKRQMEAPLLNPLNLAHSQVLAAMEMLSKKLNATLKSTNADYQIKLSENACKYDLQFIVQLKIEGSRKTLDYRFSLLSDLGTGSTLDKLNIAISEDTKWKNLLELQPKLDGTYSDGYARYADLQAKMGSQCKNIPVIKKRIISLPYVKYAELAKLEPSSVSTIRFYVIDNGLDTFRNANEYEVNYTGTCGWFRSKNKLRILVQSVFRDIELDSPNAEEILSSFFENGNCDD